MLEMYACQISHKNKDSYDRFLWLWCQKCMLVKNMFMLETYVCQKYMYLFSEINDHQIYSADFPRKSDLNISSKKILNTEGQISKKWFEENYFSYDKAYDSALQDISCGIYFF